MNFKKHYRIKTHKISLLSCVFSIIFVVVALIVRIFTGAPYKVIDYCNLREILPPAWIMSISWYLWYGALGIAFGRLIECKANTYNEINKYKGGMLFILMMTLGYAWYPLFFGCSLLFCALLICEMVFILSLLCMCYFKNINIYMFITMLLFSLWMLYMIFLNVMSLINC